MSTESLVNQFGLQLVTKDSLDLFREVTGKEPHIFLKRGLFFAHRDLHEFLMAKKAGKPVYLYTGRGPSSNSLHFGHLVPFMMTKYLQDAFDCPVVIQLTDDEKFYNNSDSLEDYTNMGRENAKDIIAVGFNPSKTFIFLNTEYIGHMYPLVTKINKNISMNQMNSIFGFNTSNNIGQISFPGMQIAPVVPECFRDILHKDSVCLVPCAIDQDPYFRLARDVVPKLNSKYSYKFSKPCLIEASFFPSLNGTKMSSSTPEGTIFLCDTPEAIAKKVAKATSGGREKSEQLKLGADLNADVCYQWLKFFMEDTENFNEITRLYGSPDLKESEVRMYTKDIKDILTKILCSISEEHKRKRLLVTDEIVNEFFKIRYIST